MKLIAIDLDGTLLSRDHVISERNRDAIIEAQRQGHIVTICSGRALQDIQEIIKQANLNVPIIGGNGAVIFNQEILQYISIPNLILEQMIDIFESHEFYYELYTNQGIYVDEISNGFMRNELDEMVKKYPEKRLLLEEMANIKNSQHHVTTVSSIHHIDLIKLEPYKIFTISFDKEKQEKLRQILSQRNDISITSGGFLTIEVGNKEVSKGNALSFLAKSLQIPLHDTVAIGDNINDLSMFQVAGTSIAMGNATEEVKSQTMHVTTTNQENGVAHVLEKFVFA